MGYRQRVSNVSIPTLPDLAMVGGGGKIIDRFEAFFVDFDLVFLDLIKQIRVGHAYIVNVKIGLWK